jgi:hypothetical protein
MKVLGAISSRTLDVVFMNKEAYDLFSSSGFLCRLDDLLKEDVQLYSKISDLIVSNTVILMTMQLSMIWAKPTSIRQKLLKFQTAWTSQQHHVWLMPVSLTPSISASSKTADTRKKHVRS